jgi:hypothetical protein
MNRRPRRAALLLFCTTLALASCTSTSPGRPAVRTSIAPTSSPTASQHASSSAVPGACPTAYAMPDPSRPQVDLIFRLSADLTSVTGTEHLTFTPDRPITELVFRLTANTAPSVAAGNSIRVVSAKADHGAREATYTRAGAAPATQGGLLRIPFASTVAAGTTVTADLAFTVTLGNGAFDRFGRVGSGASRYAWFGSAQPLLAWERGYGWHTEDMLQFTAESATSEAMRSRLTVVAPGPDTVIMSGDPASPAASAGTRTWTSVVDAARDVSVAVGPFATRDVMVGATRLRVGAFSGAVRDSLVPEFVRAVTQLSARFGPFPFPSLSVAALPLDGGGIEYPSSILMLSSSRLVAVHETAHQWFYAMVGDSQALHPFLDEAFANYAEHLVDGFPDSTASDLTAAGTVDRSTESYGANAGAYYFVTYNKGSAALGAARTAAGASRWDAAIRCYVRRNAWRIANPSDLAAALRNLPTAIAVLRKAGALP